DSSYAIVGSHDFGSTGKFDVSIEVDDSDGSSGWDSHSVFTGAGPLVMTNDPSVWTVPSDSAQDLDVASFYDQNPSDESAHTGTTNGGDGATSTGQAIASCDGGFDVIGSHAYSNTGN